MLPKCSTACPAGDIAGKVPRRPARKKAAIGKATKAATRPPPARQATSLPSTLRSLFFRRVSSAAAGTNCAGHCHAAVGKAKKGGNKATACLAGGSRTQAPCTNDVTGRVEWHDKNGWRGGFLVDEVAKKGENRRAREFDKSLKSSRASALSTDEVTSRTAGASPSWPTSLLGLANRRKGETIEGGLPEEDFQK